MTKSIIFDLWNTLAVKEISISSRLCRRFGIEKNGSFLKRYEESVQLHRWNTIEEMAVNFLNSFQVPVTEKNVEFVVETFRTGAASAYCFKDADKLLSTLKKKYKIALLSNTTAFEVLDKEGEIHEKFDCISYSFETGLLKPSRQSFENICKRLDVKPSECIFIDDLKENTDAAKDYGMDSIQFKDIEQIKERLCVD